MAKQGQNISDSQIRDIVNNQININHLGNTINNNQKNQIVNLLIEIRDSGALKSSSFKGQASKLSSQIEIVLRTSLTSSTRQKIAAGYNNCGTVSLTSSATCLAELFRLKLRP